MSPKFCVRTKRFRRCFRFRLQVKVVGHVNIGLFKIIVGVLLSSSNSAPNSGNNHHLTIPFEGGMHSFKKQVACVSRN